MNCDEETYFALDRVTFAMDDRVRSHNAIRFWFSPNDFEFHCSHASTHDESVVFVDWAISLQEIGLQIDIKKIPGIVEMSYKNHFKKE